MKKNKVKNSVPVHIRAAHKDELCALKGRYVSEPNNAPYVVWSVKHRVIVSEHESKRETIAELRQLRKDIKAGNYD